MKTVLYGRVVFTIKNWLQDLIDQANWQQDYIDDMNELADYYEG